MVTAAELETLVRLHGWRVEWSKRYQTRYAYACKGSRKKLERRYLLGEHSLAETKPEEIVSKLQ